jgi:transcriptional regulator GlxA family with amidase domain
VEIAFAWKYLGVLPKADMGLGFDLFNQDLDDRLGKRVGVSWSGCERYNQNNPSEWGNLVLVQRDHRAHVLALGGLLLLFAAAGFLLIRRSKARQEEDEAPYDIMLEKAFQFIGREIKNPKLGVGDMAAHLGVSRRSVSRLFLKCPSGSFKDYVNRVRVDQAKALLLQSTLTISEIAFAVGYDNLNTLARNFKALEKTTPGEFRRMKPRGSNHG